MTPVGLYVPGTSPIHRLPAGVKLAGLVVVALAMVLVDEPWQAAVATAVVAGCYGLAGISLWRTLRGLSLLLLMLAFAAVVHVLASGWERAVVLDTRILVVVLWATLVTATTRTNALTDALIRACSPLRIVRLDPDRIGLLLSLGIRSIAVVMSIAEEVRQAQLARGLGASPRAFAVPLVVRSLRHADALGEALQARGVDDG